SRGRWFAFCGLGCLGQGRSLGWRFRRGRRALSSSSSLRGCADLRVDVVRGEGLQVHLRPADVGEQVVVAVLADLKADVAHGVAFPLMVGKSPRWSTASGWNP